jgi:glycosyltransferase involved in cell wall biosynthesis
MPHFVLDARTATPHFPGIGRYAANLARAMGSLLASDERLTVLHDPVYPPSIAASAAVRTLSVDASPFSLAQQWKLPRLLHELDADLYHSAYFLMPYTRRPAGMPTLLTVYDLIPLLLPRQSTLRARLLARSATRLALRAARRVIAISEAARRDYLDHFRLQPEKIQAIPLAADPAFRPQSRETVAALRSRYGLPERYVLYLGSNKPHKNLERLVEAWALLQLPGSAPAAEQTLPLVIAGAWDDRYPVARQRAEALSLGAQIRWLGAAPEADLPALYAGALLFVFPSLYEGFGLPVLEAMACGTPVVCSNSSSLPEVAGDAALTVDPLDTERLASAIGQALDDECLREDLRAKGLRQAGSYSWPRTARLTIETYRRTLASDAHPSHL